MQTAVISYRSSQVYYRFAGQGKHLLFCFHGYGETAESFDCFENHLPEQYQLIAIDLPFHGGTQWTDDPYFAPDDLVSVMYSIANSLSRELNNISLVGFSMGARIVLSLVTYLPVKIAQVVLLAPDGIRENFWYRLATQNSPGRSLFAFTMQHPQWFITFTRAANAIRLIDPGVYKFIRAHIHDEGVRKELFLRWITLRAFRPNLKIIKKSIMDKKIMVTLVYGVHDPIMRPEKAAAFRKGIEPYCELLSIRAGHQVLHEKNAAIIISLLKP